MSSPSSHLLRLSLFHRSRMDMASLSADLLFSTFKVSKQAFLRTPLSFGLVNLKPIVPGHVLVCPLRVVPRLKDLRSDEVADLFLTAQRVAEVVERAYGGEGCTVSCQDGAAAGQSVPHVHIHILPRRFTDFEGENDAVYPALEAFSSDLPKNLASDNGTTSGERRERVALKMDADEDRKPRSAEEMEKEAVWLSGFF